MKHTLKSVGLAPAFPETEKDKTTFAQLLYVQNSQSAEWTSDVMTQSDAVDVAEGIRLLTIEEIKSIADLLNDLEAMK